ncbi:MAG: translation initiation factor IF-2 N-terminal domain-containing protein, partial [Polyangiaceae bacterium]
MQQTSGGSMSGKVRVYEVAKQLNLDPKQVVGLFQAIGVAEVRNHMSSVEPEAVERVKRHLEKQRTHDVVEERIRPGVLKRRAVAKPPSSLPVPPEVPSSPSLSPPMPSIRIVDEVAVAPPDVNGHPAVESPAMRDGGIAPASERVPEPASAAPATVAVRARNVADSPPVALPEERPSVRVLEPAPVPQDRLSSRTLVPAEPVSAPPAPEPPAA